MRTAIKPSEDPSCVGEILTSWLLYTLLEIYSTITIIVTE
jgi:hypothetical protein